MKYVFVQNGVVGAVIPEKDPTFPSIPISKRYSAEFLSSCVAVKDGVAVESGWLYVDGGFIGPVIEEAEETEDELVEAPAERGSEAK